MSSIDSCRKEIKPETITLPKKVIHKNSLDGGKMAVELPDPATFPRYFCFPAIVTL